MRPTNLLALGALVVVGIIIADLASNPQGTTAAANGFVSIEKPAIQGLLGKAPS